MAKHKFDVFISHAAQDAPVAKKLATTLRQSGVKVWVGDEEIKGGADWASEFEKSLDSSKAVVVLVSPASLGSQWVNYEVGRALGRAQEADLQIVPVLIKGTNVGSLPAPLRSRNAVTLSDLKRDIDKFVGRVVGNEGLSYKNKAKS